MARLLPAAYGSSAAVVGLRALPATAEVVIDMLVALEGCARSIGREGTDEVLPFEYLWRSEEEELNGKRIVTSFAGSVGRLFRRKVLCSSCDDCSEDEDG